VRRGLSVLVVIALGGLAGAAVAAAEPPPPFDGTMSFHDIQGADGPEEFSWTVKLGEEDELRAIDDTHAAVFWVGTETQAMTITAGLAHAADGAKVPTTLAVTPPNIITLTVHHRAGNPAAGGAPFDYPIIAGVGWEGGFQQTRVVMGPVTEQAAPPPTPHCEVPKLKGRYFFKLDKVLRRYGCTLGEVRGRRGSTTRVVRQFPHPHTMLPAGAEVDIRIRPVESAGVRALNRRR